MSNNSSTMIFSDDEYSKIKSVYFIGIGGISMSSLAMIAKSSGLSVAGSDTGNGAMLNRLRENGIKVNSEHHAEQIEGFDAVVYTAAINASNPELEAARRSGAVLFTRAQFLGQLMRGYSIRIGVSGMHGKSTTTSMLAHIFYSGSYDPTIINGAVCDEFGGAYRLGGKKYFIFEACEYTDSFLSFFPTTAVVLNIDMDHPDYFHSIDQIKESYSKYISLASKAVVNADDANVAEACNLSSAKKSSLEFFSFGIKAENADIKAENIVYENGISSFDITFRRKHIGRASIAIPGEHGVYDALAAFTAAYVNGAKPEEILSAIGSFRGAKRRLEFKRRLACGAALYDDYAHHPTEIRATLAGVKKLGFKRICCVFQPHTFTRTHELFDSFASAFSDADTVIFADIYAAREINESGVSSKQLASKTPNGIYVGNFEKIADFISTHIGPDDIVITMGAGDVFKISDLLK